MNKKAIALMSTVLLSALMMGCNSNTEKNKVGTSPDGNEGAIEKATMKFLDDTEKGEYELVSTEQLNDWLKSKKDMIVIDTMPADKYKNGHIPGALNAELPNSTVEETSKEEREAFVKLLGEDKNKPIIVYCGFVGCARSDVGAVIAKQEGFTEVYRQPGGIVAWEEMGYEVEK